MQLIDAEFDQLPLARDYMWQLPTAYVVALAAMADYRLHRLLPKIEAVLEGVGG